MQIRRAKVEVDLQSGRVAVPGRAGEAEIVRPIEAEGYTAEPNAG